MSTLENQEEIELTTNRKALQVNLRQEIYGTFAEIGAGQEVARHFFKVGGAAGTIAKSMSAYDMTFSDSIYGKATRYVSRDRLMQMLDHEFELLHERLSEKRGKETRFFVFANTVAAKSFSGQGESHGWMGMRMQLKPETEPVDMIIHVRMLDRTNASQQDALGILGVNFIYAAVNYYDDPDRFIESLADNVGVERIEVDMVSVSGDALSHIDNRLLALRLVETNLTDAVMFGEDNTVLLAANEVYKKAVMVERGSFRPVTHVNIDMLNSAGAMFMQEPQVMGKDVVVLFEITMKNLLAASKRGEVDYQDFLARVDTLLALGYKVLISNYSEYFRLSAYFRRYTNDMVGLVLGINNLLEIFNEKYYENLDGGILEAMGRLFKENVRLYVYPMTGANFNKYLVERADGGNGPVAAQRFADDVLISAENLQVKNNLRHLYAFLLEMHCIEPVVGFNRELLSVYSREIFSNIQEGNPAWKEHVPEAAAKVIEGRNFWRKQVEAAG